MVETLEYERKEILALVDIDSRTHLLISTSTVRERNKSVKIEIIGEEKVLDFMLQEKVWVDKVINALAKAKEILEF
jgi:hypothetical protein